MWTPDRHTWLLGGTLGIVCVLIALGTFSASVWAATPTPPPQLATAIASGEIPTPSSAQQTAVASGTFSPPPGGAPPGGAMRTVLPSGTFVPPVGMMAFPPGGTATPTTTACTPYTATTTYANVAFETQRTAGEGIAKNFWGSAGTAGMQEQYTEATGGQRLVQYFDKGRMELADTGSGKVTNGLLATELISGRVQTGESTFQAHAAPAIPIAGDPDGAGPTYAALGGKAASLLSATSAHIGTLVRTTVATDGTVTMAESAAGTGATAITIYDMTTQHNVPQAFAQLREHAGIAAIGYAKSEAFLATVKVGGTQKQVMIQVFERRVLTYTADNTPDFQVEMGNIGQHYYRWRYCGA